MSIKLYLGPMFSGKSCRLIQRAQTKILQNPPNNIKDKGKGPKVVVLKHSSDNRFDDSNLVSHDGKILPAIAVSTLEGWIKLHHKEYPYHFPKYIFIDEIQFFDTDDVMSFVKEMKEWGSHLVFSGLDKAFDLRPFECVEELSKIADWIFRLQGKCKDCEQPSIYTHRLDDKITPEHQTLRSKEQTFIVGGEDIYIPLCKDCYHKRNPK